MKFNIFEYFQAKPTVVLGERYSLVKWLSTNGLEQTFLGGDLQAPGHPDCIVRQFQLPEDYLSEIQAVRALFRAEVEGRSRLKVHECIPQLLAHFEIDDKFYLVEEKVEGHSLSKELAAPVPWSDRRVVALLNDLLSTLDYIHQRRVVHLNLQPSNLIRRREGSRLSIVSFGSFQQASARAIEPTASISTPPLFFTSLYMPDEQIAGHAHPNSDLYAIGLIAIRALTGCRPEAIPIHPQTRELNWHSLASLRHPALLKFLDSLVQYNLRTRCQTASEALAALSALPPEITWFAPTAEVFTNQLVLPALPVAPAEMGIAAVVQKQPSSGQPIFRRAVLPVGVGILALLGISTFWVWRMPNPTAVSERDRSASNNAALSKPSADVLKDAKTEAALSDQSAKSAGDSQTDFNGSSAAIAPNATTADNEAIATPSSTIALAPEAAKATVNRFYGFVAGRSWDSARSLLSDNMSQRLEPDFFDQFQNVSVENLRVVNQTPETADLVVQNTYVYPDGSSQQEDRNYTVQMVGNQPMIVDTAFVEVVKDRSYEE